MRVRLALAIGLVAGVCSAFAVGDTTPGVARPGVIGGGVTLLSSGWKIAPAGRHIQVGHLPLAMLESPDGKSLLVANNGFAQPSISVVDLQNEIVREALRLDHAWLGMAWHPDGKRLYVSGAGNNTVHELRWANGSLTKGPDLALGPPMPSPEERADHPEAVRQNFIGGLTIAPDGGRLFAVHVFGQLLSVVDLAAHRVVHRVELPAEPYTSVVSPDGATVFVSIWGGAKILMYDARTLQARGEIAVGEHPNAMALTKDGKRLFVACANTNAVWAIDLESRRASEQISVALYPQAPPGSTPNHVSLSIDDTRLLVANADNNAVAVVDVTKPGASEVEGFIPTGWYPTGAMFSRDGSRVFLMSGKGVSASTPNPRFFTRSLPGGEAQFVGAMLTGAVSILPTPDRRALETLTKLTYSVTPYSDEHRLAPPGAPGASPIPARVGDPSPIKHVFYVIRENRTYDQVLGDLERGNGDPTLTLFGESVTPNAHALVREFGVLDNFYVDAEVSYDGHAWSTGAYATDIVEKFWPTNYARRGASYLSEGGGHMRNAYGNAAAPLNGYIWDAVVRKGLTVRSYGEFAEWGSGSKAERQAGRVPAVAAVPGLQGRVSPTYPPWDLEVTDQRRVEAFLQEFKENDAVGQVPAFSIIRMGNDHTNGTRPGMPTPRAMVAENDLAIGRMVGAISKSRIWKESAIFIVEDDAQNGPDHVDAHRSIAIIVSPFSRRRVVDSTMYTTSGILRTMELILGVPPMSQYDAAATPAYNAFQATPDVTSFTHLDARVSIDEKNDQRAWGAEASMRMNLAEADMAPERELNEILWRSVKGAHAPMPPMMRSAFVRRVADVDGDGR